jgi:hypothetical protein
MIHQEIYYEYLLNIFFRLPLSDPNTVNLSGGDRGFPHSGRRSFSWRWRWRSSIASEPDHGITCRE